MTIQDEMMFPKYLYPYSVDSYLDISVPTITNHVIYSSYISNHQIIKSYCPAIIVYINYQIILPSNYCTYRILKSSHHVT